MVKTLIKSFIQTPKNFCFEGEDRDEEILYVLRKAPITNIWWILILVAMLIAPMLINSYLLKLNSEYPKAIPGSFVFVVNSFWYLATFGLAFERFLNWFFNVYIISNKRLIDMDFAHLLNRNISEAPLRNIEDITYTVKGLFQTIFDYGNVNIQTAGEKREIEFDLVTNPSKVQDILSDLVSEIKGTYD